MLGLVLIREIDTSIQLLRDTVVLTKREGYLEVHQSTVKTKHRNPEKQYYWPLIEWRVNFGKVPQGLILQDSYLKCVFGE